MFQPLSVQVTNKYLFLDKNEPGYTSKIRFVDPRMSHLIICILPTTKCEKLWK